MMETALITINWLAAGTDPVNRAAPDRDRTFADSGVSSGATVSSLMPPTILAGVLVAALPLAAVAQPPAPDATQLLAAHLVEHAEAHYPEGDVEIADLLGVAAAWLAAYPGQLTGSEARRVVESVYSLYQGEAPMGGRPRAGPSPPPEKPPVPTIEPEVAGVRAVPPARTDGNVRPFLQWFGSVGALAGGILLWQSEVTTCRDTVYGLAGALPDYVSIGDISEENVSITSEGVCLTYTDKARQRLGFIGSGVGLGMLLLSYAMPESPIEASPANGGSLSIQHRIRW